MQFQVPQFIETEDKIVGPMTLRQFVYVGIGAGTCFILFFAVKLWLWAILTIIILGSSIALAFIRINNRPLIRVVISASRFLWEPQTFIWQQEEKSSQKITKPSQPSRGFPMENLIRGMALKNTWQKLQTGSKKSEGQNKKLSQEIKDRYQIFERLTGEREAARRIDYR